MARKNSSESRSQAGNSTESEEQGEAKLPAEQEGGEPTRSRLSFRPRVDIYETEEGLVLLADMPGARPDGVDVNLDRRELTIRACVEEEDEPDQMSIIHREYQVGDFERRFQLAGDFDIEKIEAKLTNGVLHLKLPKAPQPEAKRIEVRSG